MNDDMFVVAGARPISATALDAAPKSLRIVRTVRLISGVLISQQLHHTSTDASQAPTAQAIHSLLVSAYPLAILGIALLYTNRWFTFIDDETVILSDATRPLKSTIALFLSGVGQHEHPPLFNIFLHFWLRMTGGSFHWLRVPSVVFFVLGLWMLSRATRLISDAPSAAALIWLGVFWPYGFHFGRLAGWYSFAFLIISALTWAYLRFYKMPVLKSWTVIWLLGFALVCTNYFGWAIIGLLGADYWLRHGNQPAAGRRLAGSAAMLVAAYAPFWRAFLKELTQGTHWSLTWRALVLNAGFNVYSLLVSESVAPWFWQFGIIATIAVAACFILVFLCTDGAARRFLVFGALLVAAMAMSGILSTKRLLLVAPWVLLPFAIALGTPTRRRLRPALAVSLLVVGGVGWFGMYSRHYYAAPRFNEPWAQVASEAARNVREGGIVIGNNPSFFFYLTYALQVPKSDGHWRFAGVLPYDTVSENVWDAANWIRASRPMRRRMVWVRGMPGPDFGTPMAAVAGWLDQKCSIRNVNRLVRDLNYDLKQNSAPELRNLVWRVEVREYDCGQ